MHVWSSGGEWDVCGAGGGCDRSVCRIAPSRRASRHVDVNGSEDGPPVTCVDARGGRGDRLRTTCNWVQFCTLAGGAGPATSPGLTMQARARPRCRSADIRVPGDPRPVVTRMGDAARTWSEPRGKVSLSTGVRSPTESGPPPAGTGPGAPRELPTGLSGSSRAGRHGWAGCTRRTAASGAPTTHHWSWKDTT